MKNRVVLFISLFATLYISAQIGVSNIGVLPPVLNENSGLIFFGDKLITHNDSGNEPVLYEIDTVSLSVTRAITIENVVNNDWEDITQDDTYIYIGDFGNNLGMRTNLSVYRISKQDFIQSESVMAEIIEFSYEDQTDFQDQGSSDWDAEGLIAKDDQLIIFTKQWKSLQTVAYTIPKIPGNYIAQRIGEFAINGLVTGASYVEESNEIFLLGHSTILESFVYQITDPVNENIFQGNVSKLDVDLGFGQTEGITYVGGGRFFISSESFTREVPTITLSAQLMALQFPVDEEEEETPGEETPGEETPGEETPGENEEQDLLFSIYRADSPYKVSYKLETNDQVLARAVFTVTGKMVQFETNSEINSNSIDISTLRTGVYYLVFYLSTDVISKPFLVN